MDNDLWVKEPVDRFYFGMTLKAKYWFFPYFCAYEAFLQFWRICNPPASDISIYNAKHLRDNTLIHIFADKTSLWWENELHISGIANPQVLPQRMAYPLELGIIIVDTLVHIHYTITIIKTEYYE